MTDEPMLVPVTEWRWAGAILVVGLVAFMIGASFWKPAEFEVSAAGGLDAMARHRGRIHWIVGWMIAGLALTAIGLKALHHCLESSPGTFSSRWFALSFGVGAVLMTGCLLILALLVTNTSIQQGTKLPALLRWKSVAGALFVGHMLLAYGAWIFLGMTLFATNVLPPWVGWTSVIVGSVFLGGFVFMRGGYFAPPFWAHVLPAAIGIALSRLASPPRHDRHHGLVADS